MLRCAGRQTARLFSNRITSTAPVLVGTSSVAAGSGFADLLQLLQHRDQSRPLSSWFAPTPALSSAKVVAGGSGDFGFAIGLELEELEYQKKGKKRFDLDPPTVPFGTKNHPAVVKSVFDERIVGCSRGFGGAQKQAVARVNTEALKFIAQGVGAVLEVDRILPYTEPSDARLQPLLKVMHFTDHNWQNGLAHDMRAKENFEMALEVDSSNNDAMLFLSRLYMYYHIPGTSPASGAILLEAAANAGNPIAQYELACRLRAEGQILGIGLGGDGMDEKAFKYLELAACKKHPEALFLMGSIYIAGKHTKQDVKAAAWCFRIAADQGHVAAATVYGALIAKGILASAPKEKSLADLPEKVDDLHVNILGSSIVKDDEDFSEELAESARHYFEIAAEGGDGLALEWLNKIPVPEDSSQNQRGAEENSLGQVKQ